ncbi:hypothetical protein WS58_03365 [Burkholderia pseudomultivorans]|uniref:hypothetical protein n=1 Tax=Burkholderia pseudomultivorans TaxID=1207504 RepID=UPI0007570DD2|nr:hypothetical protein [Burkholderia pseudomultivorans]KVC52518.1 hypothetical protein WS58_03365 [Burkholderia pseudomultivorans]
MKVNFAKLFKRRDEPAQVSAPEPAPAAPQKPAGKRRYGKGKRRHPAPRGATRIDPAGPLIEQARQARGIKQ